MRRHGKRRQFIIALFIACGLGSACIQPIKDGARQTLTGTYIALTQAQQAFVAIDRDAQEKIVANEASTVAEAREKIAEHRLKRDKIAHAFVAAYSAIAAADATISLFNVGGVPLAELLVTLSNVKNRVTDVVNAIKALRETTP